MSQLKMIFCLLVTFLFSTQAHADIYQAIDKYMENSENGPVEYSAALGGCKDAVVRWKNQDNLTYLFKKAPERIRNECLGFFIRGVNEGDISSSRILVIMPALEANDQASVYHNIEEKLDQASCLDLRRSAQRGLVDGAAALGYTPRMSFEESKPIMVNYWQAQFNKLSRNGCATEVEKISSSLHPAIAKELL